jgi:hypothetical protein
MTDTFSTWLDEQYPAPSSQGLEDHATGASLSQWLDEQYPSRAECVTDDEGVPSHVRERARRSPGSPRRRARFIVIGILFAGFGVAIPYFIVGVLVARYAPQREESDPLQPERPDWFTAVQVPSAHMKRLDLLKGKPWLLEVRCADLGDEWLTHLQNADSLKYLTLEKVGVTSAGLGHLKNLVQLEELDLSDNHISGAGLEHLAGLTRLTRLDLHNTDVTDEGLKHLVGMTRLTQLNLRNTLVTDKGMKSLLGLNKLQSLELDGTAVTGSDADW